MFGALAYISSLPWPALGTRIKSMFENFENRLDGRYAAVFSLQYLRKP